MNDSLLKINPNIDLVLERSVDVPVELVWDAWTKPEQLMQWFCPLPWKTIECEIDLRPGGIFRTVMESPEGMKVPGIGCYLEVVPNKRLTWTSALQPGYRPSLADPNDPFGFFTAVVNLEKTEKGTKYTAVAIHTDENQKKKHEEMGFHEGWGTAFDQLVAMIKKGNT
ncbi:SRPBCC family protein [Leptospira jelokensis]|uniref:SRPBCC family protein n=1 Tax=Leptospira jelokensis TaxID=2484931 RepID=UPI0010915888|nr:SRPBCC family protein [Leptospira jelokensis]TGM01673.1 polyketide cyclase [Leptospira jelokensis]